MQRLFVVRPVQDLLQKFHGTRCVRQRQIAKAACSRWRGSGGLENALKNILRDRPVGKFSDRLADCEFWDFSLHFITLTVRETRDGRGEVFPAGENALEFSICDQ